MTNEATAPTGLLRRLANLPVLATFKLRNFAVLIAITVVVGLGGNMQMIALGWLVLSMTNSALALGVVWAVHSAPFFLFGILSGAISDKFDRRKVLLAAWLGISVSALVMGLLIDTGLVQLWEIFILIFIMGTLGTLDMPVRQTMIVDVAGSERAMNAISISMFAGRVTGIGGGAAAGIIIAKLGTEWAFYVMSIAYFIAVVMMLFVRGIPKRVSLAQQSVKKNFVEAVAIIKDNQIVRLLMIMAIVCQILGFSYNTVLPVFARDILKIGAVGLGILQSAASVGGIVGSLGLAMLGNFKHKGPLMLGIFLFFGIFLLLFAHSPWYWASLVLMGGIGAMAAMFDTMQNILLQLNVTENQRGRAMGLWIFCLGVTPLGSMIIGFMSAKLGAPMAVTINGLAILITFVAAVIFVPKLRKI